MPLFNAITQIVGGLVFFTLALQTVTRAFRDLSGVYLKVALNLLARNRFSALVVGAALSFFLASTSGATVLLVGMGNAGLLGLRQALAVILGAAIGTTLTVQIIAFDIGNWSVYLIAIGFLLRLAGRYDRWKNVGTVILGVGLLFFGLGMMKGGFQAALASGGLRGFRAFLVDLSANSFYLFLAGIALTALLQSSATTLALAFALRLPVEAAIPLAIGASVGTCAAGLVSGIASKPIGRRIAVGHFIMKLVAASFFMLILSSFIRAVTIWSVRIGVYSPERVIANANTLYTVLSALIFVPLLPAVEELVTTIAGGNGLERIPGMSLGDFDEPARALSAARAQAVRMGRTALEMLRNDLVAFLVNAHRVTDDILVGEDSLDTYDAVLTDYLSRLDERRLSAEENRTRNRLGYIVKNIEHIGDVLAGELVPLARKKARKGLDFSIEGAQQFERFHRLVADDFSETLDALDGTPANTDAVLQNAARVDALRRELVESHIKRVSQGVVADTETSRILLDAIAALRSIHYYACDIVKVLRP